MVKTLRDLFYQYNAAGYIVADKIGMSRSRVYRAIKPVMKNRIPPDTRLGDAEQIAKYFGYQVIITLEPLRQAQDAPINGQEGGK